MVISFVLLFLMIGGLILWGLVDSQVSWIFKILVTVSFCALTILLGSTIATFLGWSALERDLPETVDIHHVIIKEPSNSTGDKGRIYLLVESTRSQSDRFFLKMFSYENKRNEPRLFSIPYSRGLHEKLEKDVIPRLKQGGVVSGKFKKGHGNKGEGDGKGGGSGKGDGKGGGKGNGSESQEQEYHFYELVPSDIAPKTKQHK
jgi:uncharacterized membrane protein YgcG